MKMKITSIKRFFAVAVLTCMLSLNVSAAGTHYHDLVLCKYKCDGKHIPRETMLTKVVDKILYIILHGIYG